jgi:hypothetical protein
MIPRALWIALVVMVPLGCARTEPRTPVQGSVTLDGQPLEEGEIYFVTPGLPPEVLPVRGGRFTGSVRPGQVRVEIYAYRTTEAPAIDSAAPPAAEGPELGPGKENIIPARFNQESNLQAEVPTSGEAADMVFEIESK